MLHAESSVKKFGGKSTDYLPIHQWFDDTKAHFPDNRHRALRHHTQGIFECERVFGVTIKNGDGKDVSVRDIGEQHVMEDLGFIPTVSDYLMNMVYKDWMHGKGKPPSSTTPDIPATQPIVIQQPVIQPPMPPPPWDDNPSRPTIYD